MRGFIVTLHADGRETVREILSSPTLGVLQGAIGGGYLELVPGFTTFHFRGRDERCSAFADENGKLNGLPFNMPATAHWSQALDVHIKDMRDHLVGDVAIVFGDRDFMEAL